ncbi:MAG: AIR synthase-related protein, partial [Gammaproteobacteria bacterium]
GAHENDAVYVTGTIGDASAGLKIRQHHLSASHSISDALVDRLENPLPRVAEGMALRGLASAAIDISDGLAADLGHVLTASHVGADISIEALPLSDALLSLKLSEARQQAVCGGDDYELCITVPVDNEQQVQQKLDALGCPYTRIGTITPQQQVLRWLDENGNEVNWNVKGYDHFAQTQDDAGNDKC